MKLTGSKLIKVASAYGRDVLEDSETRAIVVDIDGKLVLAKDYAEAFEIAGNNQAPVGFDNAGEN